MSERTLTLFFGNDVVVAMAVAPFSISVAVVTVATAIAVTTAARRPASGSCVKPITNTSKRLTAKPTIAIVNRTTVNAKLKLA